MDVEDVETIDPSWGCQLNVAFPFVAFFLVGERWMPLTGGRKRDWGKDANQGLANRTCRILRSAWYSRSEA